MAAGFRCFEIEIPAAAMGRWKALGEELGYEIVEVRGQESILELDFLKFRARRVPLEHAGRRVWNLLRGGERIFSFEVMREDAGLVTGLVFPWRSIKESKKFIEALGAKVIKEEGM